MSKVRKKIAVQLLGLKKSEVDTHIQNLMDINNRRLSEIKEKIQILKVENEKLSKELNDLTEEMSAQKKSQKIINFGLKKSEQIALLINKVAKEEEESLSSEWKKRECEIDSEIDEYNTIITNTKENIEKLLQNIMISNESFMHIIKTHPEIIAENKEIIENKERIEEISEEIENTESVVTPIEEKQENNIQNSFWGEDLGEFIVTNNEQNEVNNLIDNNKLNNELDKKGDIEQTEKEFNASKEMEMEIKNIKNNYLIGKIVGEDLFDNNGGRIAYKNEHITEDIIEKAEKSGKLVDLILNMSIPDQSA